MHAVGCARGSQELIETKLEKKGRSALGASPGRKAVLFVDDVNMPAREVFGAQPPIELLRQFLDFRGFYDRKTWQWREIWDMTIIAACAPPGGGRNPLTARFTRHFSMLCLPTPSEAVMKWIFKAILTGHVNDFTPEIKTMVNAIVDSSVEVYQRIREELLPTPAKSHYTFNLRDLSKVFQGILMARPKVVVSSAAMTRLWLHESMRVFCDRLTCDEDKR